MLEKTLRNIGCSFAVAIGLMATQTSAATIEVQVLDASSISLSLSGALVGSPPFNAHVLFVDTPVSTSVNSNWISITGDAMLGSQPIQNAFSGYNNSPYGGTLQLRGGDISNPFSAGDLLTGSATIVFHIPHGMLQSMFDGIGAPIYWGRLDGPSFGDFQGYAVSAPNPVPLPATLPLYGTGLGLMALFGWWKRRRAVVAV